MNYISNTMNVRFLTFLKNRWRSIVFVVILCFILYHSFYLEDLKKRKAAMVELEFNVEQYVQELWPEILQKQDEAPAATELLLLMYSDMAGAIKKYATKTKDVSSTHFFLLQGQGKAATITEEGVSLSIADTQEELQVFIVTDFIFGNAVRNASGLVDSDLFSDSMDYNRISEAINAKIMNDVIPPFRNKVQEGLAVSFFGAAQVFESDPQIRPWKVIPIHLEVK